MAHLGTPGTPINGHPLGRESRTENRDTPSSHWPKITTSHETTRYLAAATQIDTRYAADVVRRVFGEPLRALAPGYGVDVPVVTMWAAKALRTQAKRDSILITILTAQVATVAVTIITTPWVLLALPFLFLVAWVAASWEYWERIHHCLRKQLLRGRFEPAQAPEPKDPAEADRLSDLRNRKDGNLVVFSGSSAFVGTGATAYNRRMLFDITYTKKPEDRTAEEDFTSHDLHVAIVEAFSSESGLGKSLENVKVYERLFVNGRHIRGNDNLLPDPLKPPLTKIAPDLLAAAAANPTDDSRSYVCVEIPGWHGQLVVTLFVRAVYTGKTLFVEWTFRVLPSLRKQFLAIDTCFEFRVHQQISDSLRAGLRETLPALLASPASVLRRTLAPTAARKRLRWLNYAIPNGYVYDYGATRSIREDASDGTIGNFFLTRDESMYILLSQQTLVRAVHDFLRDHGIELESFDKQAQVIFDNSIHIGDIKDSSGVAVGTNANASASNKPGGSNG